MTDNVDPLNDKSDVAGKIEKSETDQSKQPEKVEVSLFVAANLALKHLNNELQEQQKEVDNTRLLIDVIATLSRSRIILLGDKLTYELEYGKLNDEQRAKHKDAVLAMFKEEGVNVG